MSTKSFEDTQTLYTNVFADRRKYPRVKLKTLGAMRCPDGSAATVAVYDIAPDGMQVRCGKDIANRIHPGGTPIPAGKPGPAVELSAGLRRGKDSVSLRIRGTMIYFALINPEIVAIGIKFGAMSPAVREALEQIIAEALMPRE